MIQLTTEPCPFNRDDFRHDHVRDSYTAFLGYEEVNSSSKVQTYQNGNIVTLDGNSGPWLARQIMGPYGGVLVDYWDDALIRDDADLIAEEFGWRRFSVSRDLRRMSINDDNAESVLFGRRHVNAIPLQGNMEIRPIHG